MVGDTVIPVLDLAARMKMLSAKTPDKKSNHFHEEFKVNSYTSIMHLLEDGIGKELFLSDAW
jgi:hypothetical protein